MNSNRKCHKTYMVCCRNSLCTDYSYVVIKIFSKNKKTKQVNVATITPQLQRQKTVTAQNYISSYDTSHSHTAVKFKPIFAMLHSIPNTFQQSCCIASTSVTVDNHTKQMLVLPPTSLACRYNILKIVL